MPTDTPHTWTRTLSPRQLPAGVPVIAARPAAEMVARPGRGMRFAHARARQALPGLRIDEQPAELCRVTRTTSTTVYYRSGDGTANRYRIERDRFGEVVGAVLLAERPAAE